MNKIITMSKVRDFLCRHRLIKLLVLYCLLFLLTAIIASQNFFFQSIVENGISKKILLRKKLLQLLMLSVQSSIKKRLRRKLNLF